MKILTFVLEEIIFHLPDHPPLSASHDYETIHAENLSSEQKFKLMNLHMSHVLYQYSSHKWRVLLVSDIIYERQEPLTLDPNPILEEFDHTFMLVMWPWTHGIQCLADLA